MKRQLALDLLEQARGELSERFGVTRLALFGSVARDAATDSSDVDILVAFDGPATSKRYFGVQFFLEDLMGCSVDLVTEKALRPELRPFVEQSLIDVWRTSARVALLVDALPGATLFDLGGLQEELQALLGLQVDVLTPGDLPAKFRSRVLAEARPV